jgi:hypothetical protein
MRKVQGAEALRVCKGIARQLITGKRGANFGRTEAVIQCRYLLGGGVVGRQYIMAKRHGNGKTGSRTWDEAFTKTIAQINVHNNQARSIHRTAVYTYGTTIILTSQQLATAHVLYKQSFILRTRMHINRAHHPSCLIDIYILRKETVSTMFPVPCAAYFLLVFSFAASSSGCVGLELSLLFVSSLFFCAFSPSGAPPCSLGLLATVPDWPSLWFSGSGDWRPWLGADILGCV